MDIINTLNKTSNETKQITFDFNSSLVSSQEVITAVTFNATVSVGNDPTPSSIIGQSSFVGGLVSLLVTAGITGNSYVISCTSTTSSGQILEKTVNVVVSNQDPNTSIVSRQSLADFCLRQLGGGVINVEVSDDQIEDCIDSAVKYYQEYHFDGIERDYYVYKLQGTQVTVDSASGFIVGQPLSSMDWKTTAYISSINGNVITINKQIGYTKFAVGDQVTTSGNLSPLATIQAITLGDPDNGYITLSSDVYGVIRLLNLTSILGSSDYMFNVQYQIMMSEIQNLTSQGMAYFYGVQQYLGELDFVMKKEKDFRFNRRMEKLFIDVDWRYDLKVGDIVAVELYRIVDPTLYPSAYSDIWLRRYTTALIKRQWGNNLRKYEGLQLPGGVTFSGQTLYNEATNEMALLEQEAINDSAPLNFFIG